MKYIRIFMLLFLCCITGITTIHAQSAGDNLYKQGMELQKIQTVKSQQTAIAKFTSAKKAYDSIIKKKQCDDAIEVSNGIIRTLKKKTPVGNNQNETQKSSIKVSSLSVSKDTLIVNAEESVIYVNVTTNEDDWYATALTKEDQIPFISVSADKENKNIKVEFQQNISTIPRQQTIEVRAGNLKTDVQIVQKGKPIVLSVSRTLVNIKGKNTTSSIDVYSNSNQSESVNNHVNWKIESKPSWLNVIGEPAKKKSVLGKFWDKTKGFVTGQAKNSDNTDIIPSVMNIIAQNKDKQEPSRNGEIVISSGDQKITIIVQQE